MGRRWSRSSAKPSSEHNAAVLELTGWQNFFVIVGSSAGALIGLQFVVIALVSSIRPRALSSGARAFATPTIVFFSTVLLTAGLLSIPHQTRDWIGVELLAIGVVGTTYAAWVGHHIRKQESYEADHGDWAWFFILPASSFVAFFIAGATIWSRPGAALDIVAAATLLLLFIGVHNAWDGAVYMVANAPSDASADR